MTRQVKIGRSAQVLSFSAAHRQAEEQSISAVPTSEAPKFRRRRRKRHECLRSSKPRVFLWRIAGSSSDAAYRTWLGCSRPDPVKFCPPNASDSARPWSARAYSGIAAAQWLYGEELIWRSATAKGMDSDEEDDASGRYAFKRVATQWTGIIFGNRRHILNPSQILHYWQLPTKSAIEYPLRRPMSILTPNELALCRDRRILRNREGTSRLF